MALLGCEGWYWDGVALLIMGTGRDDAMCGGGVDGWKRHENVVYIVRNGRERLAWCYATMDALHVGSSEVSGELGGTCWAGEVDGDKVVLTGGVRGEMDGGAGRAWDGGIGADEIYDVFAGGCRWTREADGREG